MLIVEVILWIVMALVVYAYAGFPLLLLMRGLIRRPITKQEVTPSVSLVVIAHNEEESIQEKLENILALDYPRDRLQVLIGSDGSDDKTDEIVARYSDRGVELHSLPRSGKIPTLNATVAHATGDVLVFSDANSMFDTTAIRALMRCFADPTVGAVAGNQCYSSDTKNAASLGERMYWSFDRFLKQIQSTSGNATSSTGSIHAIRRKLFRPVPLAVCDDFVISTRAVEQGYRLVFEPDAIAREAVAATDSAEFSRKVRVITRGLGGLWAVRPLFNPFRFGFYSFQLTSHKLLRWSVTWLLVILLVVSAALANSTPFYWWLLNAQLVFYGCGLIAFLLRSTSIVCVPTFRLLNVPYYFCLVNIAAACGWLQLLRGRRIDVWNSNRSQQGGSVGCASVGSSSTAAVKR